MRDQRTFFDLTQDGLVLGQKMQRVYPRFELSAFVSAVRTEMVGQTLHNVTTAIGSVLRDYLPPEYADALAIIRTYVTREAPREPMANPTLAVETSLRPIAHFLRLYGVADIAASLDVFGELARHRCTRGSDIRACLIADAEQCFARFGEWVADDNANLRFFVAAALCTRGTWQKWLRPYISDPSPILTLLETLKSDPDAQVREQVATDMRDIVKDYPEAGYATLTRWAAEGGAEMEKLLRQALKYQVKIGDERAFRLLGLGAVPKLGTAAVALHGPEAERQVLPINAVFRFSFGLESDSDDAQVILTYYVVSYKRPTGHITRKRYRLSQRRLKPRQRVSYEKSVFPLPSLKQYENGRVCLGWHRFEVEVNGTVLGGIDVEGTAPTHKKSG